MNKELKREFLVETQSGDLAIYWVLKGPRGAVSFHLLVYQNPKHGFYKVTPVDICTHSLKPQYPEHSPYGLCEFLNNGICYGDVDTLTADALWSNIQTAPRTVDTNEVIWNELERKYEELI